jgi:hypothetical protein
MEYLSEVNFGDLVQLPESFFKLTSAELKLMIEQQKYRNQELENRPLMTKKMREREEMLRRQKYPKTMIRVRFSNRFVLEATFLSRNTGISL